MQAYLKELLRTLTGSISRFISIMIIVALGVFFFVGIRATSPDMKETTGQYIVDQNIYDVHVYAPYGLTDEDVDAIKNIEGVGQVDTTYSIDMILKAADTNLILTALQLPKEGELNQPKLLEGSMPQADDECVVDSVFMKKYNYQIGDTITLEPGEDQQEDQITINSFKIVGTVTDPLYISLLDRGASTLGSGKIAGYVLLNKDVFNLDVYTDIYVAASSPSEYGPMYDEYTDSMEPIVTALKDLGYDRASIRGDEVRNEAQSKIDDAKKQVEDAKAELADAKKQLDDAEKEIANGEKELKDATAEYNSQIASAQKKIDDAKAELASGKAEIDKNEAELDAAQGEIDEANKKITAGLAEIAKQKETLEAQKPYMTEEQYDLALAQITSAENDLLAQQTVLQQKQAEITAGYTKITQAKADYEAGVKELEKNEAAFLTEKANGKKQLASAKAELEQGKKDLAEGKAEYEEKSADAYKEIEDAEQEIADGQKKIDDLIEAKWYVTGASENPGIQSYKQDTERLASIGDVFPVLFFLVAALVCLTVMTRMVEEDRTKIGTLKALGYTNGAILVKYLLYALFASVIGSILGALVGFDMLPNIIATAYSSLYAVPEISTPIRNGLLLEATIFSMVATIIPAMIVCHQELQHTPAVLMRPKAPKPGKRILLEHVPFIWKRLSFTKKVTLRNIFRYKSRFVMTLLGIAGCTMLILMGFGLNDSIGGVVDISFTKIAKYDSMVILSKSNDLNSALTSDSRISSFLYTDREDIVAQKDDIKEDNGIQLVVPKGDVTSFISLYTTDTHQPISLEDSGVVITNRLSELLGVDVGGTITIANEDEDRTAKVTVTGICENYIGHYVYMSEKSYESAFGIKPATTAVLIINAPDTNEEELSEYLLSEGALNVTLNSTLISTFNDSIGNITYVVFVLIISAAALAFVVLFSLTSINIEERIRELATIKVLGFYDREVASYVYRENILLTIMGAFLGLVFGYFMHGYVLTTMEKDVLKFTRYISPQSYIYSLLLTIAFGIIVNFIMNRRLKKINMVESLKSAE